MLKTKWRIVTDAYAGYEVQCKQWWWPFWYQHGFANTHPTIERANRYIAKHTKRVVWP